ncbi:MAG TPA: hypothetical protein PKD00_00825 [Burkholderiales bacterium]|nr:hypothetical protein [Burkholderiales bacterium]
MITAEIAADSISPKGDRVITLLVTFPRIILAEVNTHRALSKNTSSSRAIPFNKMVKAVQNNPFIPIAWQKDHKGMQGIKYFENEKEIKAKVNCWLSARNNAIKLAKFLNSDLVVHEISGEEFISYNQLDEDSIESLRAKERLKDTKVTKQICNRLLEPFMWTTMLITGSKEGWDNFFKLRNPEYHLENVPTVGEGLSLSDETITLVGKSKRQLIEEINSIDNDNYAAFKTKVREYDSLDWLKMNKSQAEIHISTLAECIYDAMNESTPQKLAEGEWHLPFGNNLEPEKLIPLASSILTKHKRERSIPLDELQETIDMLAVKIVTSMAARTSYTIVGEEKKVSYEDHIKLHDNLVKQNPPHSSPAEHASRAMTSREYYSFAKTYVTNNLTEGIKEDVKKGKTTVKEKGDFYEVTEFGWCRNIRGFIQYRHILETE